MSKTKKSNNTKNNSNLDQLELFRDSETFREDDNGDRDFEDNNLVIDYVDKENTSQSRSDKISKLENDVSEQSSPEILSLPDRFESLKNSSTQQIQNIIIPVENALAHFDDTYTDIRSSGRGAFWILRGQTGSGKSTFLNTIHLFREGVESFSILAHDSIPSYLSQFTANSDKKLSVLVIEGREARKDISDESLESDLHAINGFIRALSGRLTL